MRTKIDIPMLILLTGSLIFLASCQRVTIRVESIPQNTPKGQSIYITGNFNNWDPGDANYQLSLAADSNYYITLPPGFGAIDYKFTRGDWTTVEKDICGDEIDNRELFTADADTVSNNIESWNDLDPENCPRLTIVIEEVPENTPEDDVIALASNLNSWDPDDASISKITSSGTRYITIDRPPGVNNLEYKLTRGSLSSSESDEFGNEVSNRTMEFGKKDTIKVSVKGWTDKPENKPVRVVLLISHLPKNTPASDPVFFASNLNSWAAGDKNYQFQRNNEGQLFYSLPRKKFMLDYKITRGDWSTVEVDKNGYDISNRQTNLENADTVVLTISRWKDMGGSGDDDMTIILDRVPESTPENAKLYISGSFNDWDPGKLRYKFWKDATGRYFINLPRRNGDFEFRITRGSWESTQVDAYGSDIPAYLYNYQDFDTLTLSIDNWKDLSKKEMDQVTIVIDKIPENTPVNDQIFLAPDFNGWNPEDRQLIFRRLTDGRPVLTFATHGNKMDFKITRGGWHTVEVNQYGEEIPNRTLYFGFADTVYLEIDRWKDR